MKRSRSGRERSTRLRLNVTWDEVSFGLKRNQCAGHEISGEKEAWKHGLAPVQFNVQVWPKGLFFQ